MEKDENVAEEPSNFNSLKGALLQFITSPNLAVATFKGPWGAGKTYFWEDFIKCNETSLDAFDRYVYVSLFGIRDVAHLRQVLCAKSVATNAGGKGGVMDFFTKKIGEFKRKTEGVDHAMVQGLSVVNSLFEENLLKKVLICIDNMERMEESLKPTELMGFVSSLCQENECKVILVYNEGEVGSRAEQVINKYREKVIDMEMSFHPSIDRNLKLAWNDSVIPDQVQRNAEKMQCFNIRILRHVFRVRQHFAKFLGDKYPNIMESFMDHCDILTILYFAHSHKLNLSDIIDPGYRSLLAQKSEAPTNGEKLIADIQFYPAEFDAMILDYLSNGHVDIELFAPLLKTANDVRSNSALRDKVYDIAREFYGTFSVGESDYVAKLTSFLKAECERITPFEFAALKKILDYIIPGIDLDTHLEDSINQYVKIISRVAESNFHFPHNSTDFPDVVVKIQERIDSMRNFESSYSLGDLMIRLAGGNGWTPKEIKFLLKYSEDDFYRWLETDATSDTPRLCKVFLDRFTGMGFEKEVSDKLRLALDRIKIRSNIDRARIEFMSQISG